MYRAPMRRSKLRSLRPVRLGLFGLGGLGFWLWIGLVGGGLRLVGDGLSGVELVGDWLLSGLCCCCRCCCCCCCFGRLGFLLGSFFGSFLEGLVAIVGD